MDLKIILLNDKFGKKFFWISIFKKYNYKQYILKNDLLYTFFVVVNFLYKYGFYQK